MTRGSIIGNLYLQSKSIMVKLWNELTSKDSNKIKKKVLLIIFVFSFRYNHIDIDKTIYSKTVDVNSINKIFDVEIDKFKLEKYRDKNYTVLEDMKVDPQSKQFFKQLYKYVKNNIESNEINLYNQYTHKQQSKEVNIV